jgi:hypothetical protein
MASQGKSGVSASDRTRDAALAKSRQAKAKTDAAAAAPQPAADADSASGESCGCGCKDKAAAPSAKLSATPAITVKPKLRKKVDSGSCRAAALARRKAHSSRGKAGVGASGMSSAQTARAANPGLSGRELAQALRDEKSRRGSAGQKKSQPTGRQRPARNTEVGAAQDAPWKVGASDTSHGQTVTGTMVGRSGAVTGDEASTCRPVTGTEYMGADIFRDFCQTDIEKTPLRVGVSATAFGNSVTGNRVGRGSQVTGDEPGTCKNVTGTDYISADQAEKFCATPTKAKPTPVASAQTRKGKSVTGDNVGRSARVTGDESGAGRTLTGTQYTAPAQGSAPAKVGESATLRGGSITGSMVGRNANMTGDEAGSCRNVTGDDYIGREQFSEFCDATPKPQDQKVGVSNTLAGKRVTGTMSGRAAAVTGNEPGTCKAVTGTPYAGSDQYQGFCDTDSAQKATARMQPSANTAGAVMTGQQPSVGGSLTGDSKGVCETVSGTPYVGADQMATACPGVAAEPNSPDFPQPLEQAEWGDFSVSSPAKAARDSQQGGDSGVTGSSYEQGQITGPFGMATGKVTGTEEARFGRQQGQPEPTPAPVAREELNGRTLSRITGEGVDAGSKITGDDWDRGDRVTGTEGVSAVKRNPTIRSTPMSAMAVSQISARDAEVPQPVSRVTGGSGNTDRGALITYSGGARG